MVDTAAVRALRSMDLIPYVLENPGVSIAELSARFSVTQAQIESDLQLVFMCGLPGYTPYELIDVAFEDGVVSIIDPQVLDKPRKFSSNVIVVIALGLKIFIDINQTNSTALTKLKQLSEKIAQLGSNKSILMAGDVSAFPFFEIISKDTSLRDKLEENTTYFKQHIIEAGFDIKAGNSPIVPIMLYDAALSQQFANELLEEGVYAIGFFFPVVAKGQARIRTQISAAHSKEDLDKAIAAFIKVGKNLNVIS